MSESVAVYVASCSCGRWRRKGTADDLDRLVRRHDDSPFQRHIVSILPCGPARDADFERARLAAVAAHEQATP
jgi:hypothetical protein